MKNKIENIFVVGTDTGIGKTVLSLILMQFFYSRGETPFYIKPIQTGCRDPYDPDSDAGFIYKNVKALKRKDPSDSVIYCFKKPKAPCFAARDERKKIDLQVIGEFLEKKSRVFYPIIIEAAGGVLVPVDEKNLMVDLIQFTAAKPVIAARAGLGTINHTLLTIEALTKRGIRISGVVFLDPGEEATQDKMIKENIEAVEKASGIKVAGVIKNIRDFSKLREEDRQTLEKIFEK